MGLDPSGVGIGSDLGSGSGLMEVEDSIFLAVLRIAHFSYIFRFGLETSNGQLLRTAFLFYIHANPSDNWTSGYSCWLKGIIQYPIQLKSSVMALSLPIFEITISRSVII